MMTTGKVLTAIVASAVALTVWLQPQRALAHVDERTAVKAHHGKAPRHGGGKKKGGSGGKKNSSQLDWPSDHAPLIAFLRPNASGFVPFVEKLADGAVGNASALRVDVISERKPRLLYIHSLLSPQEAADLIAAATPLLSKNGVVGVHGSQNIRTSSGARLSGSKFPVAKAVDRRILALFQRQFSGSHAERLNVLRYDAGQQYRRPTDGFGGVGGALHRAYQKKYREWNESRSGGGGVGKKMRRPEPVLDRAVTILLFLQNADDGGNTSLPYIPAAANAGSAGEAEALAQAAAGGTRPPWPPSGFRPGKDDPCDAARFYQGRGAAVGDAIAFYAMGEDGRSDATSLHMGCPVKAGTKFVATKWLMVPLPPS